VEGGLARWSGVFTLRTGQAVSATIFWFIGNGRCSHHQGEGMSVGIGTDARGERREAWLNEKVLLGFVEDAVHHPHVRVLFVCRFSGAGAFARRVLAKCDIGRLTNIALFCASNDAQTWAPLGEMRTPYGFDSEEGESEAVVEVPRYEEDDADSDDGRDVQVGPLIAEALRDVKAAHLEWGSAAGDCTTRHPKADFIAQMGHLMGGMCSTFPTAYVSAYEKQLDLFGTTFFYGLATANEIGRAVVERVNASSAHRFEWTPSPWCGPLGTAGAHS
jgi:hypothetical protein